MRGEVPALGKILGSGLGDELANDLGGRAKALVKASSLCEVTASRSIPNFRR
jgi:hypothetical protein